ncbi:type VI secretion system tip protein TssI/VgrG [Vibrio plantisponsor]|uniref:Type VI secretion system tip protein TssI/VgrG n=2 Tax=Vibrio plantisponsor TaxID=664643 RepID=A0ABU4IPM4_9VIBR|nr:type VI secretion system tip protein TssI/VgrG [Vibrio plantisponsor]MDW6020059.1 type VI secretion system tip protein TssI/VgrG [Vibrio plantisponsor]
MTKLNFTLTVDGLPEDTFVVREYKGYESLSDTLLDNGDTCYGFRYYIDLASRQANLTANNIVDRNAHLKVYRNGEEVQQVNGIVRSFSQGDTGHSHSYYSVTLVPSLERLSLRQNCRIFQLKTVPEIITLLLNEMGISDVVFTLKQPKKKREFCVQYRENDLAFVQRLAAEEGIVYHFAHKDGKHTLFFNDDSNTQPKLNTPIPYNAAAGGTADSTYVFSLIKSTQSDVSEVQLSDYSFKKPDYLFSQTSAGTEMDDRQRYEHFDFPGRFKDNENGKAYSQARLSFLRREAKTAIAKSNEPALQAGYKFDLEEHLDDTNNRDWLVVYAQHSATQPQALEEAGGHGATTYSNQLKLIPAHIHWQATPMAKPQVDGPCIATVVGPEGEEIFCDEHGRVKLHFPWDRYSKGDEHSSCWVRVSQSWAGSQYGVIAVPRIGHEVIVSFLNGDPDQPIVTGRTYHATNTPPYLLPENKTKTVIRTETHKGTGFNELSFEDQANQEKIYLHAQKDYEADVLNDHSTHIKHDKHLTVDNDQFSYIKNNQHTTVNGERRLKVGKDFTQIIYGNHHHKVGSLYATIAGSEIHLQSGSKIVIEAGAEITFKAAGSFVKIDASGVSIVGSAINLNSGGRAGKGSGYQGQHPILPNGVENRQPPTQGSSQVSYQQLMNAENNHVPAVKTCPLVKENN